MTTCPRAALALLGALALGCGSRSRPAATPTATPAPAPAPGPVLARLPDLPAPRVVGTPRFLSAAACDRCHLALPGEPALRDAAGRDISPRTAWAASMMALAAREPYYLAALSRELAARPDAQGTIERTCLRCHAPAGELERAATGASLGLPDLVRGTSTVAELAREGVGCTLCHGLAPDGLGSEASFTGGFTLAPGRVQFGVHDAPLAMPMFMMTKYTPVPSAHLGQSVLCAPCHTVLTRALDARGQPSGPELPEQTTYLEWQNSDFDDQRPAATRSPRAAPCQRCHMPGLDADGAAIVTALSTRPPGLPARPGYGRHSFTGGNVYMLRLMAADPAAHGGEPTAAALHAAASDAEALLAGAAALTLTTPAAPAGQRAIAVRVDNLTGHKLPTGYPTRRMWLHLTVRDAAGQVVFESGAHLAGALHAPAARRFGAPGARLDPLGAILPHRDVITAPDQVQVWEAVPTDAAGRRTHLLLAATALAKDDRILPAGHRADHPSAARTQPRGAGLASDADFLPGSDTVTYRFAAPAAAGPLHADLELLYQSVTPDTLEDYRPIATAEAQSFVLATTRRPPDPVVMARATTLLP